MLDLEYKQTKCVLFLMNFLLKLPRTNQQNYTKDCLEQSLSEIPPKKSYAASKDVQLGNMVSEWFFALHIERIFGLYTFALASLALAYRINAAAAKNSIQSTAESHIKASGQAPLPNRSTEFKWIIHYMRILPVFQVCCLLFERILKL